MLRILALLLALANAGYLAWTQGWLARVGFAPAQQREPVRLDEQIRPEGLRVLAADETRRVEAAVSAVPKAPECLQAGLFDERQASAVRNWVSAQLPPGSWTFEDGTEPARWIVYMGKYPNADAVARKKAELRQINVSFEALVSPELEPGLSLGHFANQAAATTQLNELARRGVRTARVVQERAEFKGQTLRLPAVDDGLRARLEDLKGQLQGKNLRACP